MAAPIAHIFLAIQMLSGPLKGLFNEKEFIRGTSFPDIRYLKCVERADTHVENVSLSDIKKEQDSFRAGLLLHSFVDEQREKYIEDQGIYRKLSQFRFTTQTLKFAEDKILSSHFDIKPYQSYFNEICDEEREYNVSDEAIDQWHTFLREYFNGNFSSRELVMKYFDLNDPDALKLKRWFFSWVYARKIDQAITDVVDDDETKQVLLDFYLNFSENMEKTL